MKWLGKNDIPVLTEYIKLLTFFCFQNIPRRNFSISLSVLALTKSYGSDLIVDLIKCTFLH